ncbi:MAG: ribosome-associated translation inhibitor RaiA [Firmicutes bacterium]|nr:ribosome-associated translation inhibitor RaiA [Bacillota bacterium]
MEITIHTRNYITSKKFQDLVEKKLLRIEKYFAKDASCTVVCSKIGNTERMELTISTKTHSFRAQSESKNMFSNIDSVLSKIERQIVRNKEKLRATIRKEAIEEKRYAYSKTKQIVKLAPAQVKKNKSFEIKILSDKEAEVNLATLDHNFYIYADEATRDVKVMYRRADGHVGIIDVTNATIEAGKTKK